MTSRKQLMLIRVITIIAILLISQYGFASSQDEAIMLVNPNYTNNSSTSSSSSSNSQTVTTGENSLSYQGNGSSTGSNSNTLSTSLVQNMSGSSISTISNTLKASGSTAGEAATSLIGAGYSTSEVSSALKDAGYDTASVDNFLRVDTGKLQPPDTTSTTPLNTSSTTLNTSSTTSNGTVTFTNTGNGSSSAQQGLVDDITNAQSLFQDLGFDPASATINITADPNGEYGGCQGSVSKDGSSMSLDLYATTDKDGNYVHKGPNGETTPVPPGGMQHEYAHLVYENLSGGLGGSGWDRTVDPSTTNEGQALNEGFAHYFGRQAGADGNFGSDPTSVATEDYVKALESLAKDIGQGKTNSLVYTAASLLDGNYTFKGMKDALIKADAQLNGGANSAAINKYLTY